MDLYLVSSWLPSLQMPHTLHSASSQSPPPTRHVHKCSQFGAGLVILKNIAIIISEVHTPTELISPVNNQRDQNQLDSAISLYLLWPSSQVSAQCFVVDVLTDRVRGYIQHQSVNAVYVIKRILLHRFGDPTGAFNHVLSMKLNVGLNNY